jgi:hypothetical protein
LGVGGWTKGGNQKAEGANAAERFPTRRRRDAEGFCSSSRYNQEPRTKNQQLLLSFLPSPLNFLGAAATEGGRQSTQRGVRGQGSGVSANKPRITNHYAKQGGIWYSGFGLDAETEANAETRRRRDADLQEPRTNNCSNLRTQASAVAGSLREPLHERALTTRNQERRSNRGWAPMDAERFLTRRRGDANIEEPGTRNQEPRTSNDSFDPQMDTHFADFEGRDRGPGAGDPCARPL